MPPKSILKRPSGPIASSSSAVHEAVAPQPKRTVVVSKTRASGLASQSANKASRRTVQDLGEDSNDDGDDDQDQDDEQSEDDDANGDSDDDDRSEDDSDDDGLEELTATAREDQRLQPKKLKNPTLRPTPAPAFSQALSHLLSLPPTTSSLAPKHAPPSAQAQRLERRARSLLRETKAQHFARGHVRDVIGGWGARPPLPFSLWESKQARNFERAQRGETDATEVVESGAEREKRLRKLAQRGVVRLFNAIGAAQGASNERTDRDDVKRRRIDDGSSHAGSQATTSLGDLALPGGKVTRRPNVLGGRGKGEALSNLSKQSFLDLIRAGTSSSVSASA